MHLELHDLGSLGTVSVSCTHGTWYRRPGFELNDMDSADTMPFAWMITCVMVRLGLALRIGIGSIARAHDDHLCHDCVIATFCDQRREDTWVTGGLHGKISSSECAVRFFKVFD